MEQSTEFANSILEKKFKILRTSIMLGNLVNKEEMLAEYRDTAREIDEIKRNVYLEEVASKLYSTDNLEDERDRLIALTECIEGRIQERNDFIDDYIKVTSNFLDDLSPVSYEDELPSYKLRLNDILEYLDNCNKINELSEEIKNIRDLLQVKYENKANNEIINIKLEDELIDSFNKLITDSNYYSKLNYVDIEEELRRLNDSILEKREVMNTFISSYEALSSAGISGSEREEYKSYVQDAKNDYYSDLEKKYILEIYKLVLDKISEYDKLYLKREKLASILDERINARMELEITDIDRLDYFNNLCMEQFNIIKSQKYNIDDIDELIVKVTNCEDKLNELVERNKRPEIVSLLHEYAIQDEEIYTPEMPNGEEIIEEVKKQNNVNSSVESNMVIKVREPVDMNVKTASDTAKLVMKKVVIVLEPKKFGHKRDKLEEAQRELDERRHQEELMALENEVKVDTATTTDSESIFLDNSSNIEINEPEETELVIPAEIMIEEAKDETMDLFSETDPFLDDNEFEIAEIDANDEDDTVMPIIDNIGTVKPNSKLTEIEDAIGEQNDIIFPTMGLTDSDKTDVPIVSENYIN